MLHKIRDSKGNIICLCGDKFYEDYIKMPKYTDKFILVKNEQNI